MTRLDIRLLGDLAVSVDDVPVEIAGRQQRALLTVLAFRANQVVAPDQLIDALWGPTPPPSAAAGLRVSVSKLRRALEPHDSPVRLMTEPGGYVLLLEPSETDVRRFEALIAQAGNASAPAKRRVLLEQALALWRGAPKAGLEYDAGLRAELTRLEELRELAVDDRIDCELILGRHQELVPELEALVAATPLRERRHAQLMRALSLSGRRAEALEVYRRIRTRLVDELGMEPGPELRDLERSILAQDDEPVSRPPADASSVPRPKRRRRRRWLLAGSAAAVAAVVAALTTGRLLADEQAPQDLGSVARLDPDTGAVLDQLPIRARIQVGDGFGTVAVDDDVWVLNSIDNTVSRIDPESDTMTASVEVGTDTADIALSAGDLWVTNPAQNRVSRVDGGTDEVVGRVPTGLLPQGITEADGDVWVANHRGRPSGSVWRIDPETERVVARIPVGAREYRSGPSWIAEGAGSVWVGVPNLSAVVRIDPATNAVVATIPVPDGGVCGNVFATDEGVWAASGFCGDGALTRIDPLTNTVVARIRSTHWHTVFGGTGGFGSVWITTDGGPFQIDPATNLVMSRLALAGDPAFGGDLAVGAGSLWVHDAGTQTLLRIDVPTP